MKAVEPAYKLRKKNSASRAFVSGHLHDPLILQGLERELDTPSRESQAPSMGEEGLPAEPTWSVSCSKKKKKKRKKEECRTGQAGIGLWGVGGGVLGKMGPSSPSSSLPTQGPKRPYCGQEAISQGASFCSELRLATVPLPVNTSPAPAL